MASPYDGIPEDKWLDKTKELVEQHPLKMSEILDAANVAWGHLWKTTVGMGESSFSFSDLQPPATIVGYLFERIFARELAARHPKVWVGGKGSQKDLHCITDERMSVEMKASGQIGYKVFGNRSYGQQGEAEAAKKDKSGYYITINFYGRQITLLRFGWIDAADWQSQKAQTGQMAGLSDRIYRLKLLPIRGPYELDAHVVLVDGVGGKTLAELEAAGIHTIGELIAAGDAKCPPRLHKLRGKAREKYGKLD